LKIPKTNGHPKTFQLGGLNFLPDFDRICFCWSRSKH